jgi:hypothetical protein
LPVYRTTTLFDALFDAQSAGADARWATVKTNLEAIANLANQQPDVFVFCDDTQFFAQNQNGQGVTFRNPVDQQPYSVCRQRRSTQSKQS